MDNNTEDTQGTETQGQEKTYTQAEVDAMLQAECDKRVTAALKKQQKKFDEAQKLASMNDQEKQDYEYQQRLSDLEKREQELVKKELRVEVEKQLGEKGLPADAAQFIIAVDAETTNNNMKAFEKMFNKAVELEITKRANTGAPKTGSAGATGGITPESFRKMNVAQQAEIYRTNPELYAQLTGKRK